MLAFDSIPGGGAPPASRAAVAATRGGRGPRTAGRMAAATELRARGRHGVLHGLSLRGAEQPGEPRGHLPDVRTGVDRPRHGFQSDSRRIFVAETLTWSSRDNAGQQFSIRRSASSLAFCSALPNAGLMDVDVVVIGAGMAGSSAAAWIAASQRVALIEAEEVAGYHTTGRSAAMWLRNYGPPDVRLLSRLSRAFFTTPPKGFTEVPLMRHRPVLFLGAATRPAELAVLLAEGEGLRQVDEAEAMAMVPALRRGYACGAAIEADAFDMDVSAIQQGFLRQLRARGGVFALRNRAGLIERRGGTWHVETSAGTTLRAEVVVNAAGAWGDEVAGIAGVAPISLRPLRRTASIIDPAPF